MEHLQQLLDNYLLMEEQIPCQQGEDSAISSPKLDFIPFGMAISYGIVTLLLFEKWFASAKEDFDASTKEDLGLLFKFWCFINTTILQPSKWNLYELLTTLTSI